MPTKVRVPFTLLEGIVSLYMVDEDGAAITDSPIWESVKAEGLRMVREFESVRTAPSGSKVQITHHLNEIHTIEIEKVWVINQLHVPDGTDAEFPMERGSKYILVVAWQQQYPADRWTARVYRGVTTDSEDIASNGVLHFTGRNSFRAESVVMKNNTGVITC